jgi:hypothetical protein
MATQATATPAAKRAGDPSDGPQSAANAAPLATLPGQALALPAAWVAKLASKAKDVAAAERPSVSKISLRSGIISYGGNPVKGNALPCVIMTAGHRNTYYDTPFDPNNIKNPVCFSLSLTGEDMEAHENVPDENVPDDDPEKARDPMRPRGCDGCAMNAWGSDPRQNSRGKACKETRRIILLPEDATVSAEAVMAAEMAIVDIPVTSGKNYSNFVNGLAAAAGIPPWAAISVLSTQPDAKTQFKVNFAAVNPIQDVSVLEALERRHDEACRLLLMPYDEVASTNDGKMAAGAGVSAKAPKAKY